MSLTLLYRGKNVRFSMRLKKLHWLSAILTFTLISGIIVHLVLSKDEKPSNRAEYLAIQLDELNGYSIEKTQDNLNEGSLKKEQLTALTIKLAELQNHVLRLNTLGERLAETANIPEQEFSFSKLLAIEGPSSTTVEVSYKSFSQLLTNITGPENSLDHEENKLNMLESLTFGHHIESIRYLSGRPITKSWLSSCFGICKDPFNGRATIHKDIDFASKEDDDIITTVLGVVSWSGDRYGYLIEINHGGGLKDTLWS